MNFIGRLFNSLTTQEHQDISDKITQKNDEQNYNKYYKHMSVEDMKGHINGSLMATGAMMADAQVRYRLEGGLESVVDFYDRVMEWVPQFVPKVYAMIEATEDPAERRLNYVRFAINVRLYRTIGATAIDNRAARPVTIAGADSEQELALRLADIQANQYRILRESMAYLSGKGLVVFAEIHQMVIDFFNVQFPLLDERIKQIPSSAIRAKNYKLLCKDIVLAR